MHGDSAHRSLESWSEAAYSGWQFMALEPSAAHQCGRVLSREMPARHEIREETENRESRNRG
jgi:hypothetical protein